MPEKDAATYRFDPFDLTKYALPRPSLAPDGQVGPRPRADNFFAEVGSGVRPGELRAGIVLSGPMLQARLFVRDGAPLPAGDQPHPAAGDEAKGVPGGPRNYGRDGAIDSTPRRTGEDYEPNSASGPQQSGTPMTTACALRRHRAQQRARHARTTISCRRAPSIG